MSNVICFSRSRNPRVSYVAASRGPVGTLWATDQLGRLIYFPSFVKDLEATDFFAPAAKRAEKEAAYAKALRFMTSLSEEVSFWESL